MPTCMHIWLASVIMRRCQFPLTPETNNQKQFQERPCPAEPKHTKEGLHIQSKVKDDYAKEKKEIMLKESVQISELC